MINLTEDYIKSTTYNENSFANAKKIVSKKQLLNVHITKEKDLIYGECSGSGKSNYKVSIDFVIPETPIFRCSCPSRQLPCKHSTALLYQYFIDNTIFTEGELPEGISSKRQKIEKKIENKKQEQLTPKKVNISSFIKKMTTQIEGIGLVEKFIQECFMVGLASIPISQIKTYKKDLIKELGNYYLPEYSSRVNGILSNLESAKNCNHEVDSERCFEYYDEATNDLAILYDLTKKSKSTLQKYIDEKKIVDKDSADIFTKMGYVWNLDELKNLGFYKENGQLLQLGFYCYDDDIRKNYVDIGFFINIGEDKLYRTKNIRPYKISDRLKADDTIFEITNTPEFYIYPGDINPRIRWKASTTRIITKDDLINVRNSASKDFKIVLKEVKNQLKNTLADKNPACLLFYKELIQLGNDLVIKDNNGEMILLRNCKDIPDTIVALKYTLHKKDTEDNVILGIFEHDLKTNKLIMQPISVITKTDIIRFLG